MPRTIQPQSVTDEPPKRSLRPRDADMTRVCLLTTAEEVFTEVGFEGARVDDIAKRAGVNKRMIYVYFGDKEGLYREVLRGAFLRITQRTPVSTIGDLSPRSALQAWIRAYFGFLAGHPGLVRLVEWEALGDGSRSAAAIQDVAQQEIVELTGLLERGIEAGQFRRDVPPPQVLMSIHALVFGTLSRRRLWSSLWELDLSRPEVVKLVGEFVSAMVLDGIGVGETSPLPKGSAS
jgi:TetR/AcrR family transcriptional regulator